MRSNNAEWPDDKQVDPEIGSKRHDIPGNLDVQIQRRGRVRT
jgi:hypothetical protein